MITKNILFEDNEIIVCRKDAGIATQTASVGQMDMISLLKNYRVQKKEEPYIGLVHRLDQPVEGVMVFAKTKAAAANLSKQVAQRDFGKEYFAVVNGCPKEAEGVLEHYLYRDGKTNTSSVVLPEHPQAKKARLRYAVLGSVDNGGKTQSLVHVELDTGRHHQIRVQLSAMGHPIVGDRKYGDTAQSSYEPLSLCSCRLNFCHPKTGKKMDFSIQPEGKQFHQFSCHLKA